MANVRRYFRYDVSILIHMEPVDAKGRYMGAERRQLISAAEDERLNELNEQLDLWLSKVFDASSSALYVFYVLNHRIDFMGWLLENLMESRDPRLQSDYKFRTKEDSKFTPPKSKQSSSIAPLILGLYEQIGLYIAELQAVVKNSLEGKIFLYPQKSQPLFEAKKYVNNLQELANSGVLPAKVLVLMIEKINLYATVLNRLKATYRKISRAQEWPLRQLNLSAGGFSFLTDESYPLFSNWDVFMGINDDIIVCRGKVLSRLKTDLAETPYRVGVEFDLLTAQQEQQLSLFLQRKELRDAMALIAL